MRSKLLVGSVCALACALTLTTSAQQGPKPIVIPPIAISPVTIHPNGIPVADLQDPPSDPYSQSPLSLIGAIAVPGLPIASTDLLWVDQPSGRMYFADRSNKSIDIFDAGRDLFIGRISGFFGVVSATVSSQGPNGLLVTPDNKLWVGDGIATVRVADLNLDPPAVTQSIVVGPAADGRADELAYDPVDRIILMGFDAAKPPYVAFISADTYAVLGKIQFPDATGMEQPVWDTQLHRFLINVPSSPSYVAVIDPTRMSVSKTYTVPNCSAGVNGMALAPYQRLLVSACGRALIMSALDGHIINDNITQVAGGDQVWYNAGDGRFYLTAPDSAGVPVLGVIDAETSRWIQNVVARTVRNVSAFEGNNHIFTAVRAPAAGAADTTVCASFGMVGTGCIAVFAHSGGR